MKQRTQNVVTVLAIVTAVVSAPSAVFAAHTGYSDVPDDSLYAGALGRLSAAGVVSGCTTTTFCPQGTTTRGQLALLLDRQSGNGAVAPSVNAATLMGMTPEELKGATGAAGPAGPDGAVGPQGLPGQQGLTGERGHTGTDGAAGATGLTGPQGPIGETGLTGAAGPIGATGLTGADGPVGATGLTGAEGPTGKTGLTGAQGVAGAPGPAGPAGAGTVGSLHTSNAGYLTLRTPGGNLLYMTCNYGQTSSNSETFWFGAQNSPASVTETFVGGGLTGVYAFPTIDYGVGGTNRVNPTGWPYQAVVTVNEGGALTRWDVTVTGSSGGPCTYAVYQSGSGSVSAYSPN